MGANSRQVGGNHYHTPIQHWDFVLANEIPYLEAQIIKYVVRWRKKNGIADLEKAQHFLEKLLEYERAQKEPPKATKAGTGSGSNGEGVRAAHPYQLIDE